MLIQLIKKLSTLLIMIRLWSNTLPQGPNYTVASFQISILSVLQDVTRVFETCNQYGKKHDVKSRSQWCRFLLSIGGDNLQFRPIFNVGGDGPRPRFCSGVQI